MPFRTAIILPARPENSPVEEWLAERCFGGTLNKASVEFWFEFGSTYSYLTAARIEDIAAAAGVPVL